MLIFVLNTKEILETSTIEQFLSNQFNVGVNKIGDRENSLINYYSRIRVPRTEFNCETVFNVTEELCLINKIYNDLQLALPLSNLIKEEVVIHDQSNDPTRWILVKSNNEIFLVNEIVCSDNENSFVIDRIHYRKITEKDALVFLPGKEYVEMKPEDRPVFYNRRPY